MDRDPSANVVDNEDRTTPSTGESDFGDAGDERARRAAEKDSRERGKEDAAAAPSIIPPPD